MGMNKNLRDLVSGIIFVMLTVLAALLTGIIVISIAKICPFFRKNEALFNISIIIIFLLIYVAFLWLWLSLKKK
jgi:hypothetical protein